jgi:hypothetical protein
MEVWVPLLAALVGGLIAVIPVLITLNRQSKERERDRLEQKRESKTQLEIELLRNDMKVIDETLDSDLRVLFFYGQTRIKQCWGNISEDELMENIDSYRNTTAQLLETRPIAAKLALSLGADIGRQYHSFLVCAGHTRSFLLSEGKTIEEYDAAGREASSIAAELHKTMRDKLISLRDS